MVGVIYGRLRVGLLALAVAAAAALTGCVGQVDDPIVDEDTGEAEELLIDGVVIPNPGNDKDSPDEQQDPSPNPWRPGPGGENEDPSPNPWNDPRTSSVSSPSGDGDSSSSKHH